MRQTPVRQKISRIAPLIIAASLLLPLTIAQAAGPTGEEEALTEYQNGRFPLALSADGNWMVYQDEKNLLHRVRVTDPNIDETILLPTRALALSVSRSAQDVAIETGDPCFGVVHFKPKSNAQGLTTAPRLTWVARTPAAGGKATCADVPPSESNQGLYGPQPIALSSDGQRVALPGWPIQVIDIATGRVLSKLPTEADVLHLRFIDGDRKLLAVQAKLGEQWESEATGSDMQFAVWDLAKKELASFHSTGTTGNLTPYDLLWSFSEATGELWANNTDGEYWDYSSGENKRARIKPYSVNLKQCGGKKQRQLNLPSEEWLDIAADPMGRWFAVVESRWNDIKKQPRSRLILRDGSNGKQLAKWDVDSEIRTLTPSQDGNTLFARASGKVNEKNLQTTRITWTYSGGGKIMRFDLAPKLHGIAPLPQTPWATETCLIEDETPQARDIKADKRERKLLFEVLLAVDRYRHPRKEDGPDIICIDDNQVAYQNPFGKTWGLSDNGDLWVDRGSTIEQINVRDGKVLRTLSTPRSDTVCSHMIYASQQFLSWRGDTITLRPFTDAAGPENRKVLVKKPGWSAFSVEWRGDRFGVKWVNKSDYRALAVLYDRATGKVLKEVQGQGSSISATFPGEQDEDSEPVDVFEYLEPENSVAGDTPATLPTYTWHASYMHSVRAILHDPKSKQPRTVLWDGLRPGVSATPSPNLDFGTVSSLGGSLGAWAQWNSVTLYDAATRQQLARLPVPDVQSIQWHAAERTLLRESSSFVPENVRKDDQSEYARTLRAFRID